jgi:hypothetical protein
MFSGNPLILVLGILSFVLFFSILGIKASKKQFQRENRPNWRWYWNKNRIKAPKITEYLSKDKENEK